MKYTLKYLVGRQSVDLSNDVVHGEVKPLIERDLACALGVHLGEMLDASNKSFLLEMNEYIGDLFKEIQHTKNVKYLHPWF